jgi:hypothetical protein
MQVSMFMCSTSLGDADAIYWLKYVSMMFVGIDTEICFQCHLFVLLSIPSLQYILNYIYLSPF